MTGPIETSPSRLRAIAVRLDALVHDAESARASSAGGETSPSKADFPALPVGQHAGTVWDDARPVFTRGLAVVVQALQQTAAGFRTSAANYDQADDAAATDLDGLT